MADGIDPKFVQEMDPQAVDINKEPDKEEERPIENLKAEVDRKMSKYDETLEASNALIAKLNAQNEQILNQLQSQAPPPVTNETEEYVDPYSPEYRQKIKEEVKNDVSAEIAAVNRNQVQISAILSDAANKYPDLADTNTDLRKAADKFYDTLPATLKDTPEGTELAISRAVAKVGVSMKAEASDDFVLGGGKSKTVNTYSSELKDSDRYFAKKAGLDLTNAKTAQALKDKKKAHVANRGR